MKKIIVSGLIALSLATVASATAYVEGSVGNLKVKDFTTEPSGTSYGVGFGWDSLSKDKIDDSTLFVGLGTDFKYAKIDVGSGDSVKSIDLGFDILGGYSCKMGNYGAVQPYVKLGVRRQTLDIDYSDGSTDSTSGSGFEYGAGLRYQPTAHFVIGAEYMKTKIKFSDNVDFTSVKGTVAYRW